MCRQSVISRVENGVIHTQHTAPSQNTVWNCAIDLLWRDGSKQREMLVLWWIKKLQLALKSTRTSTEMSLHTNHPNQSTNVAILMALKETSMDKTAQKGAFDRSHSKVGVQ